ncbi:MAG: hypothetical protein IPG87_19655 [Saprospiraceae bacterium]|nr:hypothetical protein [Candidatus Vicinibacter affinis]
MGIKFYLRAIKTEDPTPIFYTCHLNGKPFSRGLGYKIYPGLWDKTRQRPTEDKELIKEYLAQDPHIKSVIKNVENRINNIIQLVNAYVNNCDLNKIPIDISVLDQLLKENVFQSKKTLETASKVRKVKQHGNKSKFDTRLLRQILGRYIQGENINPIRPTQGKPIFRGHDQELQYDRKVHQTFKDHFPGCAR